MNLIEHRPTSVHVLRITGGISVAYIWNLPITVQPVEILALPLNMEEVSFPVGTNGEQLMMIVTGMPGAGKDEFIRVANSLGIKDVHMGNSVRKYAAQDGIASNDNGIGAFATGERKKFGMDIWAKRTAENVTDPDNTMVDGLRNYEELTYFKEKYENLKVVAIFANRKNRLTRIIRRGREDDITSLNELVQRDERELSWGIGNVISLADYMIVNDCSLEDFRTRSEEFIKKKLLK